jgi:hypothetical protein
VYVLQTSPQSIKHEKEEGLKQYTDVGSGTQDIPGNPERQQPGHLEK